MQGSGRAAGAVHSHNSDDVTGAAHDWGALADAIDGEVLVAGAAGYESVRRTPVARFDGGRPVAVVRCHTPRDVAETVSSARASGLPFAPRGGGHCFAGRSSTQGIVIDVGPMDSVTVSGDLATIGAGARLADIYDALAEHGVTIPAGCGPTVGIAGLTLGGGLGILGRTYGLTADRLRAAQVVLADGRIIECDEDRDAELFWGLRGAGGGQFGVVTSLVFATVPGARGDHVPPAVGRRRCRSGGRSVAGLVAGRATRTSPTGRVRTTVPTTSGCSTSRLATTRPGSSTFHSRSRILRV